MTVASDCLLGDAASHIPMLSRHKAKTRPKK